MTFLIRLRHSRTSCHAQRLPEMGDTATFPVYQHTFCVSEEPCQQEGHANTDVLWSNTSLAQKILHSKMKTTVKLQRYRQNRFLSPHVSPTRAQNSMCHWKPKSSYAFRIRQPTSRFLLLLHLHWSCSCEAVRISLVKRSTESGILFVESEGLSHCIRTLKLLFSSSQFAA